MTVLQLTISTKSYVSESVDAFFPWQKRKVLIKTCIGMLVFLAAFYLYLVGSVVSGNMQKSDLSKSLEIEQAKLYEVQGLLVLQDEIVQEFIATEGYQNSKTFDVLKRTYNVAENRYSAFYQ